MGRKTDAYRAAVEKLRIISDHLKNNPDEGESVRHFDDALWHYWTAGEETSRCTEQYIEKVWWKAKEIIDRAKAVSDASLSDGEAATSSDRLYVSDVVDMNTIQTGTLNLIIAPCGSGKTYFVEHTLKEQRCNPSEDMLYLAPTRALVRSFIQRGGSFEEIDHGREMIEYRRKHEGITAMTYAMFGKKVAEARKNDGGDLLWNNRSLICLDELSQAIRQAAYSSDNFTKEALEALKKRIGNTSNTVVTISATPKPIIKRYWDGLRWVRLLAPLEGFRNGCVHYYRELDNLLYELDPSKRGMIYVGQVNRMKDAAETLRKRGINTAMLFSDGSKDHKMSDEQRRIARILTEEERIPDEVQVLLINAAYETGLNIRPEKSRLEYIVVHNTSEEVQIQARGRYRGDLDALYLKGEHHRIPEETLAPYLSRELIASETKELAKKLAFKDDRGRVVGWTTAKKILKEAKFSISEHTKTDKQTGKRIRCTVIEPGFE